MKRPLVEEVGAATDGAATDGAAAEPGAGAEPGAAGSERGAYLEVGMTTRPLGHSLLCAPGREVPFTAPEPPTGLLDRLNKFLPNMARANEELAAELASRPEAAAERNIENCEDDAEAISMEVAIVPMADDNEDETQPDGAQGAAGDGAAAPAAEASAAAPGVTEAGAAAAPAVKVAEQEVEAEVKKAATDAALT